MRFNKTVLVTTALFLLTLKVSAQTLPRITVLHTSDLHSHFTARQSPRGLGGYARLKSKITQLRGERSNTLLLDSGDWSEGTIFFTLGSGVQSEKIMDKFGYDAMVLGNHDWLVGPNQMYESFVNSGIKTPILSANLNFKNLSPEVPLQNFIKPYVIKEIGGVKVGIFGLSTFQLLYDHFFAPITITDPIRPALETVSYLRNVEKCQVVIALSHLGISQDRLVAKAVNGIDLIVGGHTHMLMTKPEVVNGVPILHIGQWGEYLGEYQLELQANGSTKLVTHRVHQVDYTIKEDAEIRAMVSESMQEIEHKFGNPVFNDRVAFSDVDLSVSTNALSNDVMGNWSVDAMRAAGGAEIAVDSPQFASSQIRRGLINTSDIFDLFPHIYVDQKQKAWTIHTYEVNGYTLRALLTLFVKFNLAINLSNVEMTVDMTAKDPIKSILVGGKKLNLFSSYKVASNPGVLDLFRKLKSLGVPIGPKTWTDTGLEVWRVVRDDLVRRSPISSDHILFEPKLRTVAPDLMIGTEFLKFEETPRTIGIRFKVFNAGLKAAPIPKAILRVDRTPLDSLDDNWAEYHPAPRTTATSTRALSETLIEPGSFVEMEVIWPITHAAAGTMFYPIEITIDSAVGEQNTKNNSLTSYIQVMTLID